MAKRDYYTILGIEPRRDRRGHQEVLSQARDEAPSGPQSGRQGLRGEIQGSQGSVRSPDRPQEARRLRPVRARGCRSFGRIRRRPRRQGPEGFGGFADAFGDIFGEIFGQQGRGGGSGVYRGADLRYNLELSLEDAARGTEVKIRIPAMEECETCHGTGAKPGTRTQDVRHVRRPRRSARVAGFLLDPADVPDVPRHRQGDSRPLRDVPRRGPRQEAQDAVGEDPGGRRHRTTASV